MTSPITDNNFIHATPATVTDTILRPPPSAPITATNTTCPTPTTSLATSDYLPPATSIATIAPSTSEEDSVLTCPHYDRTLTSHIALELDCDCAMFADDVKIWKVIYNSADDDNFQKIF
ncbi:unnamed protein product [Schistocephalus solidus]|uniref:Uncharacterized protein n=1 Tax=Schistocephalus solidus TaxID=70667 RepID=A0A183SN44_SCHSO|nr:unnamed protein product [Schistocephalus solidus]